MAGHVYVMELQFHDGRRAHPAWIQEGAPDWERHLDEAVAWFEERHKGEAVVEVHYAKSLAFAGVGDPDRVPEWRNYRR